MAPTTHYYLRWFGSTLRWMHNMRVLEADRLTTLEGNPQPAHDIFSP